MFTIIYVSSLLLLIVGSLMAMPTSIGTGTDDYDYRTNIDYYNNFNALLRSLIADASAQGYAIPTKRRVVGADDVLLRFGRAGSSGAVAFSPNDVHLRFGKSPSKAMYDPSDLALRFG
jgi:hypothetical protein